MWSTSIPWNRTAHRRSNRPAIRRAVIELLEPRTVLSAGIVVTSVGAGTSDAARAIFLDSSGRTVLAGDTRAPGVRNDVAVVRYCADGSLDPGFDQDGVVVTKVSPWIDVALAVAKYPDPADPANDKILVGG